MNRKLLIQGENKTVLAVSRWTGVIPTTNPWDGRTKEREGDNVLGSKVVVQHCTLAIKHVCTLHDSPFTIFDQEPLTDWFNVG